MVGSASDSDTTDVGFAPSVSVDARIVLRPIGAPLPLGFLALAVGSLLMAGLQLHWISGTQGHMVAVCLLALVVPLQLISCLVAMLARDTIAATGMGLLAGTWLSIGAVLRASTPGAVSGGLGLLLVSSAGALLTVALAAVVTKPMATVVIGTTAARFACAGVYELTDRAGWQTATGVIGVVLTGLAWYAALTLLLENVSGRPLLPTLARTPAATGTAALTNDLSDLAVEPGVRHPA
jgi:succinate-acetate transporter protein